MTASDPVYLDHNASTPILPEVLGAMRPYLGEHFGNPSSDHAYGERARRAVEEARQQVADLLGSAPEEIVFTSGGTEANNLAILGVAGTRSLPGSIVTSIVEHPATTEPCRALESRGWKVFRAPVDETGRVRVSDALRAITQDTTLVTVMHANNETGTLQPVPELSRRARERGVPIHTDAAQSVGKVRVDVDALAVDLLSLAGHKLYAPKGVGALYVRTGTALRPVLLGAAHEGGLRPGTENVASIVGLGEACRIAGATLLAERSRLVELREELWARLCAGVPGIGLNGHPTSRLPNTLPVRFPRARGRAVLARAPEVAASTGSACHAGEESASPVLVAMGLGEEEALGAVRLSLGRSTTPVDVERAANALIRSWREVAS